MTSADLEKLADLIAQKVSFQPRWLKLAVASQYASLSKKRLKELAEAGVIKGYQDPGSERGDWIFDRESIDEYRTMPLMEVKQKALSILNSI